MVRVLALSEGKHLIDIFDRIHNDLVVDLYSSAMLPLHHFYDLQDLQDLQDQQDLYVVQTYLRRHVR